MRLFIFLIFVLFSSSTISAQNDAIDRGNINLHFGSIVVYNTFSIGYESPDILKKYNHHQIRLLSKIGRWNTTLLNKNAGLNGTLGFSYLIGKKNHYFEHNSEVVFHFDEGLKDQGLVHVASTYRIFLGYRYMPKNKRLFFKIGAGWYELFQIGFGYRL